ncbi:MAG: long-chain fatty acid--CoA ligase [Gemmatimonadaceae bacterium]
MRGLMMDSPLTLSALLRHAESLHGGREIVSRRADRSLHRYTYRECLERARRLGASLRALGLQRGDRVATFAWNHQRHLEAYFGLPAAGFVLHTLNLRLHADDLTYIANDAGDRAAIVDEMLWPVFEKFAGRVPFEHVVVMTENGVAPEGTLDYDTLLASAEAEPFPDLDDEREAAAMCYTSGTTGKPKGVVYSHRALVLHSMGTVMPDVIGLSSKDAVLPIVPMFHANAWGIPYSAALVGAKQVLPGRFLDAQSVVELLAAERVTVTCGVPTIWLGVLDFLDAHAGEHDLSALRHMTVGGSAAPESMIRAFDERHGITILQGWGMTETSPVASISSDRPGSESWTPEERQHYRATAGQPLPLVEIRARGDDGLVPWDGVSMGELEVRGPWVAAAYHGRDADEAFTTDGWFRTGDIVTIGPNAELIIQDRCKDLVKSGGEWISSVLLENCLMGHPSVAEAAVIAVPHAQWVERPLAVVVSRAGCRANAEELRSFLGESFAKWWVPDAVVFTDVLPRTATGKVRKLDLRQVYGGAYASGASTTESPTR